MLDCFMFSVLDVKNPRFGQKLRDDLAHQRFSAVIVSPELTPNSEPTPTDPWPEFLTRMKEQYELSDVEVRSLIYLPKSQ